MRKTKKETRIKKLISIRPSLVEVIQKQDPMGENNFSRAIDYWAQKLQKKTNKK